MMASALRNCLALLLLFGALPALAAVTASIDRNEVSMDESFTLTLTVSELRVFSQPDLSPLDQDFETLGSSQNSNTSIVNGKLSSSTSWNIQLMPRRPGKTSIPPIQVGKERSHTIELNVLPKGRNSGASGSDDVILEAELSDTTVYVTAQVLLTLRVSMAQAARFQLQEPELDNAIVQQVAETSYQQVRGSRRFQVTEYTFAIFPSEPGELVIDSLKLVAEFISSRPRSMFDPMLGQSKRVVRHTDILTINVNPPPEGIASADWLPANKLTLRDEWSKDPTTLQVGDSITRTIELAAQGAMASQLPPLFLPQVEGLKLYPDQPAVSDEQSAHGISGKRVERIAVVATRPGEFKLPEQRVSWWDVNSNQQRWAVLPAVTLNIAPGARQAPTTAAPKDDAMSVSSPSTPQAEPPVWYLHPQWWAICGFLLVLCGVLATLYFRALRRMAVADPSAPPVTSIASTEKQAHTALKKACANGDAGVVYTALQHWCQAHWHTEGLPALSELRRLGADKSLAEQAQALERDVYGSQQNGKWDPGELLRLVDSEGKRRQKTTRQDTELPALYR